MRWQEAVEPGKTRISPIDGEQLLELLIQYGIGVSEEQHTVLALDEEWWGELAGSGPSDPVPVPSTGEGPSTIAFPLAVQATVHGQMLEAELLDVSGRMRYQGVAYRSPSGAGQIAAGWKSCNGCRFWQYRDPGSREWRAIEALRE